MNYSTHQTKRDVLKILFSENPPPFALLYRPEAGGRDSIDIVTGPVYVADALADIALPVLDGHTHEVVHDRLVLIPYRQITSRGFVATDDGTPLIVMDIRQQETWQLEDVVAAIPSHRFELRNFGFDIEDEAYEKIVSTVLQNEIGEGKGANFVIKRSFLADITNYSVAGALGIFKNLLLQETGAYWTFIIHTGERTLVGATPEKHVSLDGQVATMNPISGTYRYPPTGPNLMEMINFLNNGKEVSELYMVVDEELKMMSRACDMGVWLEGPMLKEMARLAHTEYFIHGRTTMSALDLLNATMFAPTVMGGPIESAARVIHQYEPGGRGYYSGVAALISHKNDNVLLDSGILIRTADINNNGHLKISVGATLVRGSNPAEETAETRTKASGVLTALGIGSKGKFSVHPEVIDLLQRRNHSIAEFWLRDRIAPCSDNSALAGKKVLIVDEEDTFTSMINLQLRALGCNTLMRRFDEHHPFDEGYDFIVMGPGPGDPRDKSDAKIARLHRDIETLLDNKWPFLCVCLSHQVLASVLGLELSRRKDPNQGVQKEINLFGKSEIVGFYNTFSARYHEDQLLLPDGLRTAEIARDGDTGEIHAIRSDSFCSIQFHAESLLTIDGVRIYQDMLSRLCERQTGNNVTSRPALVG